MTKDDFDKMSSSIPDTPGVYFFRDSDTDLDPLGNIIYIGKATSLKSRTRSYFSPDLADKRGLKIVNMVLAAQNISYTSTPSVLEALLLENKLIKEIQPAFNTKEKDNKSYLCVVITRELFPRVLIMRVRDYENRFVKTSLEKVDTVYGPFTSGEQIRVAMKIVRKLFPYRDNCDLNMDKKCFNAEIRLCPGACYNLISEQDYRKNIKHIKNLFAGNRNKIMKDLKKDMNMYAKEEKFEMAKKVRDTIFALDHINDVALITDDDLINFKSSNYRIEAYDVAHISGQSRVGVMTVVVDDKKVTNEYRKFKLEPDINDDYQGIVEMLRRRMMRNEWAKPNIIVIDGGMGQKNIAEKVLSMLKISDVRVVSVVKDDKHKARDILGIENIIGKKLDISKKENKIEHERLKKSILLANLEAHRFAITYHKKLRAVDNFI
jgi:excinuclease ABC subunit C